MRRHRGFTLVELLIVIGIIGVLVGLLFPVVTGARDSARKAQCAANLRNVGAAMLAYGADNDRKVPLHHSPGQFLWDIAIPTRDQLVKYGATRKTLYCPNVEREGDDRYWNFTPQFSVVGYWFLMRRLPPPTSAVPPTGQDDLMSPQFAFYMRDGTNRESEAFRKGLRTAFDQPRAAELELVTDATMSTGPRGSRKFTGLSSANPYNQANHLRADKKAADGGNILFMDGRVEWRHWSEPPEDQTTPIGSDRMQIRYKPPGRNIDQWF